MNFIVFYLLTMIISFFMEVANAIRIFKDVVSEGYKIDSDRLSECNATIKSYSSGQPTISKFINSSL